MLYIKSTKKLINSSSIAFSMLLVVAILTNFLCFDNVNAEDIKKIKVSTVEDSYKNQFPSDFIEFIDNHLEIKNGTFKLKDLNSIRNYIKNNFSEVSKVLKAKNVDDAMDLLNNRFIELNKRAKNGTIFILKDGTFLETRSMLRSSNIGTLTSHWWKTRRVLHSRSEGYNFSYHLTSNANAIDAVTLIFGASYPPEALVGFLTTLYLRTLSSDVEYWADKCPSGFVLDISWVGNYRLYEK